MSTSHHPQPFHHAARAAARLAAHRKRLQDQAAAMARARDHVDPGAQPGGQYSQT